MIKIIGSRAEVWHGNANRTSGGLTKENLMMNKRGRIISIKKYELAMKEQIVKELCENQAEPIVNPF